MKKKMINNEMTAVSRYFLKMSKGEFALLMQRGMIVEIDNLSTARDAKEEEEEDHGNYVTIVELVLAKSSARRGWFTVVDSVGRLNLCGLGYGDLAIFETYRKARAVTKNVGLSVGEFKEIR